MLLNDKMLSVTSTVIVFIIFYHNTVCDKDAEIVHLSSVTTLKNVEIINDIMAQYHNYRDPLDPDTKVEFELCDVNQSDLNVDNLKNSFYNNTIDFAIINKDLTAIEKAKYPELKTITFLSGTLVFPFNVPGVTSLRVTGQLLADIFSGTITTWNHQSILSLNPNTTLPNAKIRVVARLDQSIHTQLLTNGLSAISTSWKLTRGSFDEPDLTPNFTWSEKWQRNTKDMFFVKKPFGLASVISSIPYTIGYVHAPLAFKWNLPVLSMVYNPYYNNNSTGQNVEKIQQTLDYMMTMVVGNSTNKIAVPDSTVGVPFEYTFIYFTYILLNSTMSSQDHCKEIIEILLFVNWILNDPTAQMIMMEMDLVPISSTLIQIVQVNLDKITCSSEKMYDRVKNFLEIIELQKMADNTNTSSVSLTVELVVSLIVVVVIILISYYAYQWHRLRRTVNAKNWLIPEHELTITESFEDGLSLHSFRKSIDAVTIDKNLQKVKVIWDFHVSSRCRYRGKNVIIFKTGSKRNPLSYKYKTCKRLNTLMNSIKNSNVVDMLGLFVQDGFVYHVYINPGKGALHQILIHSPYDLTEDIKYALAKDVATGLVYLHKHGVVHGLLDSWNVHLDNNWSAKVTNWSHNVCSDFEGECHLLIPSPHTFNETIDNETYERLLYRHPDILLQKVNYLEPKHDLYSFAMILIEIFTREIPYQEAALVAGGVRQVFDEMLVDRKIPIPRPDIPSSIKELIQQLTRATPQISFEGVIMHLTVHQPSNKGIVDTLLEAMENYMQTLEEKVEERTVELTSATQKMENLLVTMLPKDVAAKLQNGRAVEPQFYDSVTIFFSDVVSFTSLCSESSPLEIISFLNGLYTLFDNIIERYDVYKVETIGDAYMCVSGLPRRNGLVHVEQICKMALELVESTKTFRIKHRSDRKLQIRVGINSGPVMSGVVGIKMPRYCLFGDTVNTASRMESTSMPSRIQIAESTTTLLLKFPQFVTEQRGVLEVKGKGIMKTYWLNSCNGNK